jgi:UDP-GlcNAc:undecaprenyl-phosphate GlcNAc-1-phosphate transferase
MAAILAVFGLHPSLGFLPQWVAALVGIVWVVGITNSFNFLDGLDGLSTGVGLVGTVALLTIMGISDQPDVVFFLAALAGTQMGFLRYNYHPARIFLGSSGSLLLGYLLATSTILVTFMKGTADSWLMPLLTPLFILAIPLYDTVSVVLIRLTLKRSIAIGDQNHFHHRLLKLGFSHRQTVAYIILIAFAVALSAVRLVHANLFQGCLILLQIVVTLSLIVIAERVALRIRTDFHRRKTDPKPLELTEAEMEDRKV